jgi:Mg2+-importing ATPase
MAGSGVIVRHLSAMQDLGAIDIMCSDKTGTLTSGQIAFESSLSPTGQPSPRALRLAWWNSHYQTGVHSPLDEQILAQPRPDDDWHKLDEIPFDFQRRRLSIAVENDGTCLLITKGAPESILAVCTSFEDGASADSCRSSYESLSRQGKRVIGVAHKLLSAGTAWTADEEAGMTFAGFLVFIDPVLPEARTAITKLRHDGVSMVILTGDSDLVARNICGQLGLDNTSLILGPDLDRMTDGALAHSVEHTAIFARVTPAQKTRIILALKRRGHVVGFMGDGINDAPSLHAADVGISVPAAVDVAREAADIILTRPGLGVLHAGIIEGRRAWGNILKYLFMGTSSNFGNMLSMAVASVALSFLPMLPTQILLNNFLYDLAQITIPSDTVDAEILRRPHRWDVNLIRRFMVFVGPVSSLVDFVTFYVLLRLFGAGEKLFHTGWFVESLATQTLVLLIVRTMGNPLRSRPSRALIASVLAVAALAFLLPWTPLGEPLGFTPLPAPVLAFIFAITAVYLTLVNFVKQHLMRTTRPRSARA